MNTVNQLVVNPENLQEIKRELKQFKIRHYPFVRNGSKYIIDLFPSKKSTYFLLKYNST